METRVNNNYTVPVLIFNVVIFVVFSVLLAFKVYPLFTFINEQKVELFGNYTDYNRIIQQGISYDEFLEQKNEDSGLSEYLKDLIKAIPQSFYDKNIKNTSGGNFSDFIQNKISKIDKQKKDKLIAERDQKLETILPSYSNSIGNIGGQENLTDFKFTNYVEGLLNAFSLTSTDSIGISDILPVKSYTDSGDKKKQNSLDTNIFYIPLKLSVKGKKSDIIDFLYFIENVGSISVNKDQGVTFYQDPAFKKTLPDNDTNIFGNQIFDIESMKLPTYLDSRYTPSNLPLIDYVKQSQAEDVITLELQLRFYVRGLPDYLVKKYIKETLDKYDTLSKLLDKKVKELETKQFDTSDEILLVNSVRSLNYDLTKYGDSVSKMKVSLSKGQDMDSLYRTSQEYDKTFTTIETSLDKINKKLDINNNKK